MPRPATGKTFIARARVDRRKWNRFAAATRVQGSDNSKVLNELIDWYLRERGGVLPERPARGKVDVQYAEDEAARLAAEQNGDAPSPSPTR